MIYALKSIEIETTSKIARIFSGSISTSRLTLSSLTSGLSQSEANQPWFQCDGRFAGHDEGLDLANHLGVFSDPFDVLTTSDEQKAFKDPGKHDLCSWSQWSSCHWFQRKHILVKHWRLTACKNGIRMWKNSKVSEFLSNSSLVSEWGSRTGILLIYHKEVKNTFCKCVQHLLMRLKEPFH